MQCQKVLEERDAEPKPQADEDGPPSSEGAEDVRDITDDDESMSDSDERPHHKPHGAIFGGYFEQPLGSWVSCDVVCVAPRIVALASASHASRVGPEAATRSKMRDPRLEQLSGRFSSGSPVFLLVSAPAASLAAPPDSERSVLHRRGDAGSP